MNYQNATDSTETTMQELNTHMIDVLERIADSLERIADAMEKPLTIELDENCQRALDELAADFYESIH